MEFVVCDLETTGFQPGQDKIIEIALVRVVNDEITETFTTLVNPERGIPLKVQRLTGISDRQLAAAPVIWQVVPQLERFFSALPLVGHNIGFDRSFLEAYFGPLPFTSYLDTLELARVVFPAAPGHSLAALTTHLGLATGKQHRALEDALATTELFSRLTRKLSTLNMEVLLQLLPLLQQGHSPWARVVERLATDSLSNWHGTYISAAQPVKEPVTGNKGTLPGREANLTDASLAVEHLLGPRSPLAELLPNYEHRREQVNMAADVERTLAENKILLVEAGTGTGKSLAYMLPALLWALRHEKRALVATNTINLQQQLWNKDIPVLQKLLPVPFHAALLKGRSNYLCLRRFFQLTAAVSALTPEEALLAARVLVWLQETESGDRAELNIYGPDSETWLQICSETDSCLGGACRWQNRYCFVSRARRSAENAQLVIVNHALLFTDMTSDMKILPAHDALVIDEAHHIEDTATLYLGKKVSRSETAQWLSLAGRILRKLGEMPPPREGQKWSAALKEAEKARQELKDSAETFYNCLAAACEGQAAGGYSHGKFRLHREPDPLDGLQAQWQNFLYGWRNFLTGGLKSIHTMLEHWTAAGEPWEEKLQDVMYVLTGGNTMMHNLRFILEQPEDNYVCWVEVHRWPARQGFVNCTLYATPVDVSAMLYEKLFNTSRSIILTSATLTVNGSFDHIMGRCGLDRVAKDSIKCQVFDSPFDYENQCLLCIAEDLPLPSEAGAQEYLDALVDTIYQLVLETGGRTLVLFTSHKMLREVYQRTQPMFEETGICLLGHNLDGGRSRLVDDFVRDGRSVLFGSSSFWEGVDIPGDALVNVIIVKLPFSPPDDPVQAARHEIIAARGSNAFYALSLPQAVIRFKQGFGRLIRSGRDRGAVVVLDRRVIEKRYGRVFLNSLPVKTHLRNKLSDIRKKLAEWIQ